MAIKREYHTKRECAGLMIDEYFSSLPFWVIEKSQDWYEQWYFYGVLDEEQAEEQESEYGLVNEPMWNTWFVIDDSYMHRIIEKNEKEVMDIGFTIIKDADDDCIFALGVDGAGYSFLEHHFMPLYDLAGFKWHDGADEEEN